MSRAQVREFVRHSTLGVGRLLAVRNGMARVQYFTGPSKAPYIEREHATSAMAPAILKPHTRVYLREGPGWRIGRIEGGPDGLKRYTIAFPNLRGAVLPADAFEVRWNVPIDDPFAILESLGGDGPKVYESRPRIPQAMGTPACRSRRCRRPVVSLCGTASPPVSRCAQGVQRSGRNATCWPTKSDSARPSRPQR